MIVIAAISVLPALYAWVNIYANQNPYVNTGNIAIAAASDDPGIEIDGRKVNSAERIIEDNLKNSESIDWQFPDSTAEAIAGVESGRYYAAVIFEKDFTYNMYHFDYALSSEDAPVTFYRNDKRNAVASKITDTAAATLLESINTEYLNTLFNQFFSDTGVLASDIEDVDAVEAAISRLENMRSDLNEYDRIIASFETGSSKLLASLDGTRSGLQSKRTSGRKLISKAGSDLNTAIAAVDQMNRDLRKAEKRITKANRNLQKTLRELQNSDGLLDDAAREKLLKKANDQMDTMLSRLQLLRGIFPDSGNLPGSQGLISTLDSMISLIQDMQKDINKDPTGSEVLKNARKLLKKLEKISLSEKLDSMTGELRSGIESLYPLIENTTDMLDGIDPVLDASGETVNSLDSSLGNLRAIIGGMTGSLDSVIDKLNEAEDDDKLDILLEFLGGDPDRYGRFFSSLVDVEVTEIYPVASYGAAMAPFYSALAIWVGGVILVAILRTHIDREKFPEATERHAYFGRFLTFFVIGQVQAAVIAAGDIFLLGCAPKHPWHFWFAAAVASFVFTLLIYSLTRTFGDVGKAIVVVTMVLQIAGSSGSYPIEILPVIFSKMYRFFPFPYAINAMREALCGMYGADYWIYLGELMLFAILALAVGLLARRSFIGVDRFVSEKIEETEVL